MTRCEERPVRTGALHGVAHLPVQPSGRAILLLNAGGIRRIGPNRLYTALARRWAARGHLCLRVDLTGLGDTPARPGEPDNIVYSPRAVEDVGEAIAWLRTRPDVREVHALGLCSGGYHALKAATAGHPMTGIVVINPLTFFWKEGQSLDYPAFLTVAARARYGRSIRSLEKWKKLLRGGIDLGEVRRVLGHSIAAHTVGLARDWARRLGRPFPDDLGAELDALAARGIAMRFVFAAGDPGLGLLRRDGGSAVRRLEREGRLSIDVIDGADHTFTPLASQAALQAVLERVLGV